MVPETQTPSQTLTEAQVLEILQKGLLAPSADNLQPWRFKTRDNGVDLFLNPEHLASYCDEGFAAPYLSAGAVVENLRIAASAFGADIKVQYLPEPGHPLKAASIDWITGSAAPHPHLAALEKRCTNRKFYQFNTPVPQNVYHALEKQTDPSQGYRLLCIKKGTSHYSELASIIGKADQLRFEIFRLHHELMKVMRFNDEETSRTRDGLPVKALDAGPGAGMTFNLIRSWGRLNFMNHLGMSRSFNLYAKMQMLSSQGAGLIIAPGKAAEHYLKGGEIMERVWHEAAAQGLSIQPMEALPIFLINSELTGGRDLSGEQRKKLEALKARFYFLFGIKPWQGLILLFRIGYSSAPSARSLRRPLESFLISDAAGLKAKRD